MITLHRMLQVACMMEPCLLLGLTSALTQEKGVSYRLRTGFRRIFCMYRACSQYIIQENGQCEPKVSLSAKAYTVNACELI